MTIQQREFGFADILCFFFNLANEILFNFLDRNSIVAKIVKWELVNLYAAEIISSGDAISFPKVADQFFVINAPAQRLLATVE